MGLLWVSLLVLVHAAYCPSSEAFGSLPLPRIALSFIPKTRATAPLYSSSSATSEATDELSTSRLPDLSQAAFPDIPDEPYDLIVLGSGPAGESAAGELLNGMPWLWYNHSPFQRSIVGRPQKTEACLHSYQSALHGWERP